eukprot:SAG11_NODE_1039_length_6074_cov_11.968870_5_plen_180_part_00
MACECGQVELHARSVHVELGRLKRLRAADAAASLGSMGYVKERARVGVVEAVQQMAVASTAALARVKEVLDRYYWGVWGSARRIKTSAREVSVLAASLREAEWGASDEDLPGGQPGLQHSGSWRKMLATEWGVVGGLWARWRLVAVTAAAIAPESAPAVAACAATPRLKGGKRPAEAAP